MLGGGGGGLGGSTGFERNKANVPVWLSEKHHVTVSTQHAQYATQLLFQSSDACL